MPFDFYNDESKGDTHIRMFYASKYGNAYAHLLENDEEMLEDDKLDNRFAASHSNSPSAGSSLGREFDAEDLEGSQTEPRGAAGRDRDNSWKRRRATSDPASTKVRQSSAHSRLVRMHPSPPPIAVTYLFNQYRSYLARVCSGSAGQDPLTRLDIQLRQPREPRQPGHQPALERAPVPARGALLALHGRDRRARRRRRDPLRQQDPLPRPALLDVPLVRRVDRALR